MKLRLLPIAACVATVVFGVKVAALWQGAENFIAETFYAQPALAQSAQAQSAQTQAQSPAAAPAAKNTEIPSGETVARITPAAGSGAADDPMLMSQSEIDLLQNLAQRRNELESWSSDLSTREQLLKAAELRIETKLGELKTIQQKINASLKQHDDEQEAKLKSLVKIYETMKPKEASRIFEQLDMSILLDVVERMKEAKVAPVIAAMDPEKARKLTTEMAKRRRLAGEETQRTAEQVSKTN
jgi:flagellar motility protein MotE (MotC chaperone)